MSARKRQGRRSAPRRAASRRTKLGIAIALVALAALAIFLLVRPPRGATASRPSTVASPAPPVATAARPRAPRHVDSPEEAEQREAAVRGWQKMRQDYAEVSVFPDWSRPLSPERDDLLRWKERFIPELVPLTIDGREIIIDFTADRLHVFRGDPLVSRITAYEPGAGGTRLPLTIHEAWVLSSMGQGRLLPLRYEDDGKLEYVNRLVPSEHPELRVARQFHISMRFDVLGQTRTAELVFLYTPRVPLEVVGVTDAIQGGSLVVTLDADVREAGVFTFMANLTANDGETPIAYFSRGTPLQPGRRRVQLTFFGKVIHDRGLDGPYVVRDIRGHRNATHEEQNIWWWHPPPHRTAAYRAADFSGAEWDSDERRTKLRYFDEIISELASGEAPIAPNP